MQDNLTLNETPKPTSNGMRPPPPPPYTAVAKKPVAGPRAENIAPRGPPMHRPTRSQEQAMRARRAAGGGPGRARAPTGELDIFADPESPKKTGERRPRRNSESSILNRSGKPLDPEEEKKRQERPRRERRHHERDREAGKDPKERKSRKMDIIDQLDATSIYGTGRELLTLKKSCICIDVSSFPPRWSFRCVQPSSKPTRQQTRTYASIPQGLAQ
jgi:hypothetical protein